MTGIEYMELISGCGVKIIYRTGQMSSSSMRHFLWCSAFSSMLELYVCFSCPTFRSCPREMASHIRKDTDP